jgi:hypothetical protein
MFNGDFEEAKAQACEMKDTSVAAFQLFHSWLYTGNLVVEDMTGIVEPSVDRNKTRIEFWVLVDKFMLLSEFKITLMAAILRQFRSITKEPFSVDALKYTYTSLAHNDPMK